LLHYYFRSKEKLFLAVFENAVQKLFPSIIRIFDEEGSLADKLKSFYEIHLGFLIENPMIPGFIITEVSRRPESLKGFIDHFRKADLYGNFQSLIQKSIEKGEIKDIDPAQLLLNLISLSVFPIISEHLVSGIIGLSHAEYKDLLIARKKEAAEFVISSIMKE